LDLLGLIWNSFWHLLLNILVAINSVVHFPALAIIIFTIFMRLLTVPLTMKALRSSRNMQQIQPLMKDIQKKYGKDKAKQQEEMMKLYREYNINPAAGCFPMLIQLPIFIGLYSALDFTLKHGTDMAALGQALYVDSWAPYANFNEPFLWVTSLAHADPLFIWPVLSGLFQFIQSRMAMPLKDPNRPMDPQQRMMNGMMQFMPIYIVFISMQFPAGTVIYWAFSSLFGAVQQYFITGFGSLPDLPGLGFLPRKPLTPPSPPPKPVAVEGGVSPRKQGMMGWMMNKALEAQEAQKAAAQSQSEPASASISSDDSSSEAAEEPIRPPVRAPRPRSTGKASQPIVKTVPPGTMKYASDARRAENGSGNGMSNGNALPRKKKSKR